MAAASNSPDPSSLLPPPEPVNLLDPDGTYHEDPDHPVDLDDDALRRLYRHMVVARRVDREAINLQRQGQLGVYASLLGQEAAQVGGAFALDDQDWVFPSYREMCAAVNVQATQVDDLFTVPAVSSWRPRGRACQR